MDQQIFNKTSAGYLKSENNIRDGESDKLTDDGIMESNKSTPTFNGYICEVTKVYLTRFLCVERA